MNNLFLRNDSKVAPAAVQLPLDLRSWAALIQELMNKAVLSTLQGTQLLGTAPLRFFFSFFAFQLREIQETMNQDWDGQLTVEVSECSCFKGSELYQDFEMLDKQKLGTENKTWLKNIKEEKKLYGFFKCFGQIQVDAASLVE